MNWKSATKRVMCIWFPNWPLQRIRRAQPELELCPIILSRDCHRGGRQVVTCSREVARLGMAPGMPLAEAQALLASERKVESRLSPSVHFAPYDSQADQEVLQRLAHWCQQFSPLVGVEESPTPDSLLLDVTGCSHLFQGEPGLVKQVMCAFRQQGLSVRVAVADTIGAAWALAHYGGGPRAASPPAGSPLQFAMILSPDQQSAALQPLPLEALRLSAKAVRLLQEFDIRQIGQLQTLPRADLPSRFGTEVLRRLDQALGHVGELIVACRPPEPADASWSSEQATADRRTIEAILKQLIERIIEPLRLRREGVQQLQCRLKDRDQKSVDFSIGLVFPSTSVEHLEELINNRLDRIALPGEISDIHLRATVIVPLEARQQKLFQTDILRDHREQLAVLIDRLSSRLGEKVVLRPRLQADAQPEFAVRWSEAGGRNPVDEGRQRPQEPTLLGDQLWDRDLLRHRPLLLKPQPVPISVTSVVPNGPPIRFRWRDRTYSVAWSWGPERIETGWWREDLIRRDYYRVETASGQQFWLFRCLRQGQWFLHGEFG